MSEDPKTTQDKPKAKQRLKMLPLLVLLAAIAAVWFSGAHNTLTLEAVQHSADHLRERIADNPVLASLALIGLYAASVIFCLPVGSLLSLTAGFLFGTIWGGTLIITGSVGGSMILFSIARSAFGEGLRQRGGHIYHLIADPMERNAVSYMLFMRLIPVFPYFVTCIGPALFNIRPWTFFWTAAVGTVPVAYIYTHLGKELGEVAHLSDLFDPGLAAALGGLGLLALAPVILKKFHPGTTPAIRS